MLNNRTLNGFKHGFNGKRFLIVLILLFASVVSTKASPVTLHLAREIVAKFINANTHIKIADGSMLNHVATYRTEMGADAFYVFNVTDGFVIVAADDCAMPILGYSSESQFDLDNLPIQLETYLSDFVEQIQYGIEHRIMADDAIANQWESVKTYGTLYGTRTTTAVTPLLTDTWFQDCYYNNLCPEHPNGPCGHTYTGCTATSVGQIIRYWGYPITGQGSMTYTPSGYPEQSVDFSEAEYDYDNMPNYLDSCSSSTQVEAVATLLWHCGVALQASYGPNTTIAQSGRVPSVLQDKFLYSSDMYAQWKSDVGNDTWLTQVKAFLDLARPIHYSAWKSSGGGGHGFVCDGYDNNDLLHFNWGWGGYANGYFALTALNIYSYELNGDHYAIFNIYPNQDDPGNDDPGYNVETYQVLAYSNPSMGGTVTGSGTYDYGSNCTLTATANEDYVFSHWSKNGNLVSNTSSYSFSVTENAEYVAHFVLEDIHIGYGTNTNFSLPTCTYFSYSLSQQIYMADEMNTAACDISSISFYNTGEAKTRDFTIYMTHTNKTAFKSSSDWIPVSEADQVFSGSVTLRSNDWTVVVFDTPFNYNGYSNLVLVVDDNTGDYEYGLTCRVFNTSDCQAISGFSNGIDYDPSNPSSYYGTCRSYKNQIILGISGFSDGQTVNFYNGWNWWSTNLEITLEDLKVALVEALPSTDIRIKSRAQNIAYNPNTQRWSGLLTWDVAQMYKIYVSQDCSITLTGTAVDPAEHPIAINNGSNWIGCPVQQSILIEEAFPNYNPVNEDVIRSASGFSTYSSIMGWMGDVENIEPGKGYIYISNALRNKE